MPLTILIVLVFIGIASVLGFIMYLLAPRKTVLEERLESLVPGMVGEVSIFEKPLTAWEKFIGRLGANIPLRPDEYGKYMRMLVAAGLKKQRLAVFMGSKIVLAVALPVVYLVFYGIPFETDYLMRILSAVGLAIAGFIGPSFWLSRKVKNRQLEIFHGLPDVLDLMTVCVEAGLSMDAAMIKVCEDPNLKKSPLVTELKTVLQEVRAGKPRLEALKDMGERTMVEDLRGFAAMLIQTEKLGTSLAQSLKVFSETLRTIRSQKAQEEAAKTTVKLVFPLVFFILPALFVVMLLPALIRLSQFVKSM
jgi:tight adherence protein C